MASSRSVRGCALIALGSNRWRAGVGGPERVIRAAVARLGEAGVAVERLSRLWQTPPLGPPQRRYANAVVRGSTALDPPTLLAGLKRLERAFGRVTRRRWGPRVLDLDIVALDGCVWPSRHGWRRARRGLIVPHRALHQRLFVLEPLGEVAPGWRHPILGLTTAQLLARARRGRPAAL